MTVCLTLHILKIHCNQFRILTHDIESIIVSVVFIMKVVDYTFYASTISTSLSSNQVHNTNLQKYSYEAIICLIVTMDRCHHFCLKSRKKWMQPTSWIFSAWCFRHAYNGYDQSHMNVHVLLPSPLKDIRYSVFSRLRRDIHKLASRTAR